MKFDNVTVVAIHGNGGIEKMLPALHKSADALEGSRKLIITDKFIETEVDQKLLPHSLSYQAYSHFAIYGLHSFIDTDYALIVQDDGWVLNADNWRDEWFNYDYIGGLTHAALDGNKFEWQYQWVGKPNYENFLAVQNGGFSLRSKKFLEAPSKYGITMLPQEKMQELNNEDVQLCCFMRPTLERAGLKFAPWEEAKLFSFEHLHGVIHKGVDLTKVFGHHSRFRHLLSDNEMRMDLTPEQVKQIVLEPMVIDLFKHYGYDIQWPTPTK